MRFFKTLMASAGMLLGTAATAMAAPLMTLQDPASPVQVDVHTTETHTVWYTDPMWIAIGAAVVLLVIILLVVSSRSNSGGSSTTVVR
ncbi:MAG: hypothetical protein V4503_09755 [Gemmatimonadota bacterium]